MATYTWSIPTGKEITGATYIKETDNNISDTINDLVEFVNGEGAHAGQGLTFDLVDKASAQTISGIKTFSAIPVFSAGATFAGQAKGITPVDAEDLTRKDYVDTMAPLAGATFTGQVKGITPAAAEDLTRKDYVDTLVGDTPTSGGTGTSADPYWTKHADGTAELAQVMTVGSSGTTWTYPTNFFIAIGEVVPTGSFRSSTSAASNISFSYGDEVSVVVYCANMDGTKLSGSAAVRAHGRWKA